MASRDESFMVAMQLASASVVTMALKAAIELDVLEIMAAAGPGATLSANEIASKFVTHLNPDAPAMLDRILELLACYDIVTCTSSLVGEDGSQSRLYSLAPVSECFVKNEDGVSLAPFALLIQDSVCTQPCYHLKDAILEGGNPFNMAFGTSLFTHGMKHQRFHEVYHRALVNHSTLCINKIMESYKGFEALKELMDVGGGVGGTLGTIISKYPNIKGINFDLPHVIAQAPSIPGVKHVEGDMFESIPNAESIFMKWILHCWSDEVCLQLLRNCYKALPSSGKVIVVETILPESPRADLSAKCAFHLHMLGLVLAPSAQERSEKQFETLAKKAGFASINVVCGAYDMFVIEFYKNE